MSAHFLRPVQGVTINKQSDGTSAKQPASFEVHVKSIKGGSSMNNLQADLVQNVSVDVALFLFSPFMSTPQEKVMVTAHLIFGLSASSELIVPKETGLNALIPPSPYARRIPLRTHPSRCPIIALHPSWNFGKHISGK